LLGRKFFLNSCVVEEDLLIAAATEVLGWCNARVADGPLPGQAGSNFPALMAKPARNADTWRD